jgi:lipoprotein-anchoring transpeptidase ErfK/SrfK
MIGYGIHGTIEQDSIGRQASMGCIRMRPDDVALVYEMLSEHSTVQIRP